MADKIKCTDVVKLPGATCGHWQFKFDIGGKTYYLSYSDDEVMDQNVEQFTNTWLKLQIKSKASKAKLKNKTVLDVETS